jgi:hypothetical protein
MVLLISLVAVAVFLILPMIFGAGRGPRGQVQNDRDLKSPHKRSSDGAPFRLLYFVAVGLAYILVEIAFIQRFVLFLGHPTYALTVVIFLLLLSSGAGSLLSRRWLREPRRVWLPLLLLVIAIGIYVLILPSMLNALVGLSFALKLAVSGLVLIPLGLAMGMPFPTGLRALGGTVGDTMAQENSAGNAVEWAWAMNAASSVLGSVLAMVIAIQWGLNVTLACGAVAYLSAMGLARTLVRAER